MLMPKRVKRRVLKFPVAEENLGDRKEPDMLVRVQLYSCASNTQIAIGAHITKHNIRIVAVDIYGNIIKREAIRETYSHSPEYYQKFGKTK